MAHSVIAPSSASVWVKCSAYPMMSATFPSEDTEHTLEGTASHELGEALIAMGTCQHITPDIREDFIGQLSTGGVVYSDDMFDAAWLYADDVIREYRKRVDGEIHFGAERQVRATSVHAEAFGTMDAFLYDVKAKELIIWDYKYGMSQVEAFENWQGINYAAGVIDEFNIADQGLTVTIKIVQPRAFHRNGQIREWRVRAVDLRPYINTLHNSAQKALSSETIATTGSHCKYCEARHACMPALEAGIGLFEVARQTMPIDMSADALGVQLNIVKRALEQLKYLESAYEAQVKTIIGNGKGVKGWTLEPKYGNLKWVKRDVEVIAIGQMMGIDLSKTSVITPAQAKSKGLDEDFVKMISERQKTGLGLVPSDKTTAATVFKKG